MEKYNNEKIDEIVLALLFLNSFEDKYGTRAWKSFDWGAMNRLHEKGLISNPKSKAKSVVMLEDALLLGQKLADKYFK